jgi:hypothetical protein
VSVLLLRNISSGGLIRPPDETFRLILLNRSIFYTRLNLFNKDFSRLEAWDEVFVDYHGRVFGNIPGDLLSSLLVNEAAKPSHINRLLFGQRILYYRKKGF